MHRGGYDPEQHLKDMELDGVAGEVLYPSQGLFYFKVADPPLMSAIFRALFAEDPLRIPDFIGAGPDAPRDEAARGVLRRRLG